MEKTTREKAIETAKRLGIRPEQMPRHIAIIMDGNGRWAQNRGMPRVEGHYEGGKTVEKIAVDCSDLGIEYLTLYSFSMENWKRPKAEVDALMHLYTEYLIGIRPMMAKKQVRLLHLGRVDNLPEKLLTALSKSIELTADNPGMTLGLALNYGGRAEIVDAAKKIAGKCVEGKLAIENIDDACISQNLYTAGFPDPDLLIRTANEMRISNFLLWQISYSEFYVTETLWPDFTKSDLEKAILAYAGRSRRFGTINTPSENH